MKNVYVLLHRRVYGMDKENTPIQETLHIGIYTTEQRAKDVIERYKNLPGFKDYPDDFIIEEVELDFDDYEFE